MQREGDNLIFRYFIQYRLPWLRLSTGTKGRMEQNQLQNNLFANSQYVKYCGSGSHLTMCRHKDDLSPTHNLSMDVLLPLSFIIIMMKIAIILLYTPGDQLLTVRLDFPDFGHELFEGGKCHGWQNISGGCQLLSRTINGQQSSGRK